MNKVREIGGKLEKAAVVSVLLLCICIFRGLTYYSAGYTMMERAMDTRDNAALNLFILAAVTAAALGLRSGRLASVRRRILEWKPYIIGILSLFIWVISMVWVVNSHVAPGGDGGRSAVWRSGWSRATILI